MSMTKVKAKTWTVTVTVKSKNGTRPAVRTICDDTIFVWLDEGQTATWKVAEKIAPVA